MQVASVLGSLSAQHLLNVLGVVGVFVILFAETGLLVGFFLPGDSLLFVAGYATVAHNSLHLTLSLPALLVAAPLGAIIGAQLGYELGRRAGPRVFSRTESRLFRPEYVERSDAILRRFGYAPSIVLARFVPVVRTFLNPMAGAARVPTSTFVTWNVVGGLVWTIGLLLLGHAIGDVGVIRRHIDLLALLVVLLSVLPLAIEIGRRARKAR
jgi:membrane-associated protein